MYSHLMMTTILKRENMVLPCKPLGAVWSGQQVCGSLWSCWYSLLGFSKDLADILQERILNSHGRRRKILS